MTSGKDEQRGGMMPVGRARIVAMLFSWCALGAAVSGVCAAGDPPKELVGRWIAPTGYVDGDWVGYDFHVFTSGWEFLYKSVAHNSSTGEWKPLAELMDDAQPSLAGCYSILASDVMQIRTPWVSVVWRYSLGDAILELSQSHELPLSRVERFDWETEESGPALDKAIRGEQMFRMDCWKNDALGNWFVLELPNSVSGFVLVAFGVPDGESPISGSLPLRANVRPDGVLRSSVPASLAEQILYQRGDSAKDLVTLTRWGGDPDTSIEPGEVSVIFPASYERSLNESGCEEKVTVFFVGTLEEFNRATSGALDQVEHEERERLVRAAHYQVRRAYHEANPTCE